MYQLQKNILFIQPVTQEQALQKLKRYCSYQERCHHEVKEKLYSFKLKKHVVELLIAELIDAGFLNEERFAIQFAGGKFRTRQWGRVKIAYELKQKRVGEYLIKKALKEIDEKEYKSVLKKLATRKWNSLKQEQYLNRLAKTTNYLLQKGFESSLISESLAELRTKE